MNRGASQGKPVHPGLLVLPKQTPNQLKVIASGCPSTAASDFGQKSSKKGSQAPGRGNKKIIVSALCIIALNCHRQNLSSLPNWKLSQYINMCIYLYVCIFIHLAELPWLPPGPRGHRHRPQPSRHCRSPVSNPPGPWQDKVSSTCRDSGSPEFQKSLWRNHLPHFLLH